MKWFLVLIGATALKLWAAFAQPIQACPYPTDDAGYLRLAASLARGDWLGPYDQFTLIKGPGYPAWVALVSWSGLSLSFAQQVLSIAGARWPGYNAPA